MVLIHYHLPIIPRGYLGFFAWPSPFFNNTEVPMAQNAPRTENTVREKISKCTGPDCPVVTGYRDTLLVEESPKE
jgi:hypothetical protein